MDEQGMSFARFREGYSDVYVYEHANGFIECCGCSITEPTEWEQVGFFHANTAQEILDHLDLHIKEGHLVPELCIERIRQEHPDLNSQVPPYVEDPAKAEARKERLLKRFEGSK
jgi:hypothetical protein